MCSVADNEVLYNANENEKRKWWNKEFTRNNIFYSVIEQFVPQLPVGLDDVGPYDLSSWVGPSQIMQIRVRLIKHLGCLQGQTVFFSVGIVQNGG